MDPTVVTSFDHGTLNQGVAAVVAAIITAIGSIIVIGITNNHSKRFQVQGNQALANLQAQNNQAAKDIAELQAKLNERLQSHQHNLSIQQHDIEAKSNDELDEKKARREYVFEAKKRLYEELYPILFEITEASDSAASRITNFAKRYNDKNNREQFVRDLNNEGDNYYLKSTIYRIFIPLALYRLMQSRLTHVDLSLDKQLHGVYKLLRALFRTFGDDREIAAIANLDYQPIRELDAINRIKEPKRYTPQGLFRGKLDCIVETLIVVENDKLPRCMTFYEFSTKWSGLQDNLSEALQLLKSFTPENRPVLWIALKAQVLLHRAIVAAASEPEQQPTIAKFAQPDADILSCTDHDNDHRHTYQYLQKSKVTDMCGFSA